MPPRSAPVPPPSATLPARARRTRRRGRALAVCLAAALAAAVACRRGEPAPQASTDSATAEAQSEVAVVDTPSAASPSVPAPVTGRSPLADSIAEALVFDPTPQTWFTAAARGKRLLLDIGRVDISLRGDPRRLATYRVAVARMSWLRVGQRLRLHGPWGADDATVSGFDAWNGRIVTTLDAPPHVDSLAQRVEPLVVAAQLVDSAQEPVKDSCVRDRIGDDLALRADFVRDSLEQSLRDQAQPPYARLANSIRVQSTRAIGCFAEGRVIEIVSLRGGNVEYVLESAVLLSDSGAVTPLRVNDLRFHAHDALYAFDADGDGLDELAARAQADASGALVVLKLTPKHTLERLTSGFAWESR
jgi:hypothetical protein